MHELRELAKGKFPNVSKESVLEYLETAYAFIEGTNNPRAKGHLNRLTWVYRFVIQTSEPGSLDQKQSDQEPSEGL